jgi:hypothetical protein
MGPVIKAEGFRTGFFLSGVAVAAAMFAFKFLYRRKPVFSRE